MVTEKWQYETTSVEMDNLERQLLFCVALVYTHLLVSEFCVL